ncbi:class I SAM-dependent methyltransferase [Nostoc edaphicum CCNP1411]|uniref:Class I SAM-dependent methyltransferase n=1 Tax=Nostoc edaphicum CCNP1411 TaxID=1472755 RepID=A0A7D7LHN9_9NOSO|nr:class I SAM-dependent methyltransferase [Nostoc edaphicum]QMS90669.1 class I SAM-dependent methyltransferase [Nostoc edaphicum CCNP1411]
MRFNCDSQSAASWQIRAESAVEMFIANDISLTNNINPIRIADFGCGNERLKSVLIGKLGNQFDYYGYDLEPQLESTYKINLESEIPSLNFDIVFCLGLLEYISDIDNFLAKIPQISNFYLMSYVIRDSGAYSPADILQKGWLHHYSCQELERKFKNNDLIKIKFNLTNKDKTGLWLLQSHSFTKTYNIQ